MSHCPIFFAKDALSGNMSMNHLRIVTYVHLHKEQFELFLVTCFYFL